MSEFVVKFSESKSVRADFGDGGKLKADFSDFIKVPVVDYYDGDYRITPGASQQTIPMQGLTARENIVIDPVPSNYGLITWDGSTLTVS